MDGDDWTREWPRCLLLLELALRYADSGRAQGSAKLKDRLEESRLRMDTAPALVHTFLSEMCYVSWLLGRGDLADARHHVGEAKRKAHQIAILLQRQRCAEARSLSMKLRRRSEKILARGQQLVARSADLLTQSAALHRRNLPQSPPQRSACA